MVKNIIIGLVLMSTLLLSACNFGSSVESKLSVALSEMHSAEEDYRNAQEELNGFEKTEQQLFKQTMELTQEQNAELKNKVVELEELLEKRLVHIDKEEISMKNAKELVAPLEELLEKGDADKDHIEELKLAVNNRYDLHSSIVVEYKKLTRLQKELYEMLVTKDVELPLLQKKVDEVNEQNKTVNATVVSFNEETVAVNELKDAILAHFERK